MKKSYVLLKTNARIFARSVVYCHAYVCGTLVTVLQRAHARRQHACVNCVCSGKCLPISCARGAAGYNFETGGVTGGSRV